MDSAKKGLPAARSAICEIKPATDECEPSNSLTSDVVCESSSGARKIVWVPGTCDSAPRYSGRYVTSTSE